MANGSNVVDLDEYRLRKRDLEILNYLTWYATKPNHVNLGFAEMHPLFPDDIFYDEESALVP